MEKQRNCKGCGKNLNERGSDNDLEYCDGYCAECYDVPLYQCKEDKQQRIKELNKQLAECESELGWSKDQQTNDWAYKGNLKDLPNSENKCLFCGRVIGDFVSNYHVGCYKQKRLLEESEVQDDN